VIDKFETYLQMHACTANTIDSYVREANKFLKWCTQKDYEPEQMNYRQCTEYFNTLKNKTIKLGKPYRGVTIRNYVGIVKLYFNFLVFEEIINLNPAEKFDYLTDKDFNHNLLNQSELTNLYYCFPTLDIQPPRCPWVAIRDKVITGLAVFQGLNASALKSLNVDHVDLDKRKLHVPGSNRTNARIMTLEDYQLAHLSSYLTEHREVLQSKINHYSESLFVVNSNRFSCITAPLGKKLKSLDYKVTNLKQIRASVITIWLQKYDLRKVQIMAGHKHITSTESYKKSNPEGLRAAADEFHLMR
jgi:integrase/recombinase XerD